MSAPRATLLRSVGVALVVLAPLVALLSVVAAPAAQAGTPGSYVVTFVARQCPTYQDITANLARNNIQESLQDLGEDTKYTSGQPISPSIETPNQPNCTPLSNWDFTFGNGINGVTPGTNLSRVSNPTSPSFTTQASVPLLDTNGNPTGSTIAGAVTTTLTSAQVTAAANHQLWVQGGTPTDPLGNTAFPGEYAFGALRCAIDNLNGDNVEWVGFPTGQSSVFCYYYAVALPPKPGVIQISKVLTNAGTSTPTFPFTGTVSYNPGGTFDVAAGSSVSFTRDSNVDWNFQEGTVPGYTFTSAVCTSQSGTSTFTSDGSPPASSATFTVNDLISVDLAPGDTAGCVYTNARNEVDLTVLKQTIGGVGGPFPITVTPPTPGTVTDLSATTTAEGVPVEACPTGASPPCDVVDNPATFPADYTLAETLPGETAAGSWAATAFDCNGVAQTPTVVGQVATVVVAVADSGAENQACTFTNTFTPTGSIVITKTTVGGTGTTQFSITPVTPSDESGGDDVADPVYAATTTTAGVPVTATQVSGDYSLDSLDLGQYAIVESGPDDTPTGTWAPQSITCNGTSSDPTSSDVLVTLTAQDPVVTCAFTNAFAVNPPTPTTTTTSSTSTSTSTTTTIATTTTSTTEAGGVAAEDTGASGGGGTLALTGVDVRVPLGIGLVLALTGAAMVVVDRRRGRPATAEARPGDDHPSP